MTRKDLGIRLDPVTPVKQLKPDLKAFAREIIARFRPPKDLAGISVARRFCATRQMHVDHRHREIRPQQLLAVQRVRSHIGMAQDILAIKVKQATRRLQHGWLDPDRTRLDEMLGQASRQIPDARLVHHASFFWI